MDDQPTCGRGLAEHSTLPATLARLIEATAALLETHQRALVLEDENARREHDAYVKLAQAHRSVARQLQDTAEQMAGYRDLPMGRHDERAMASPDAFEAFRHFVALEREVLALLQRAIDRDQKMLDEMQNISALGGSDETRN